MQTALLIIHLIVAASLVTVVLFQQSEGGALGMGGGGGGAGGFMTGRGTANLLTRVTAALALTFFCTSILLTISANRGKTIPDALKKLNAPVQTGPKVPGSPSSTGGKSEAGGVLDKLKQGDFKLPKVPDGQ